MFATRRRCAMRTCLLCSNILQRYPHFLPAFVPSFLPFFLFWVCFLPVMHLPVHRRRYVRMRRGVWTLRTPTGLGSPCRSWGTSSTRGTSSRPKCSCCRRSWPTTRGVHMHQHVHLRRLSHHYCHWSLISLCSEETEDDMVTPSPSPSPELRSRSRSSAQPESGIKRLYVSLLYHTPSDSQARTDYLP